MSEPTTDHTDGVSAAPVVALHSLFFDGFMFADLRERTGRRLLAPDHRGQGTRAAEPAGSIVELADDVERLVDELGEPVHLVGSSMGAYVAIVLADRRPDLVLSCVLSAATAEAEQRPEKFAELVARLRSAGPAAMVDELTHVMFGATFLAADSAEFGHWQTHFADLNPSVADAAEHVFARGDLWAEVQRLRPPLLLLAGRLDQAKPPEDMQRIADRLGCADPIVFERSGHTPFVEQPREVADVLAPFWTTYDPKENLHA